MDKIGPDQLRILELIASLGAEDIHEVIIATNPNIEGEATAGHLTRTIKPPGVEVSRLASGVPVGGDLERADELTLGRAIEARRALKKPGKAARCGDLDPEKLQTAGRQVYRMLKRKMLETLRAWRASKGAECLLIK